MSENVKKLRSMCHNAIISLMGKKKTQTICYLVIAISLIVNINLARNRLGLKIFTSVIILIAVTIIEAIDLKNNDPKWLPIITIALCMLDIVVNIVNSLIMIIFR